MRKTVYVLYKPDWFNLSKGRWIVKKNGRVVSRHRKKVNAVLSAKKLAVKTGFSVLVQGRHGRFLKGFKPKVKSGVKPFSNGKPASVLVVKKKKKMVKKPVTVKKTWFLRKPKPGVSRVRRGQVMMREFDPYRRRMISRLMRETGMNYMQVKHLVNLDPHSDYVDIETEISECAGLSNEPVEVYEMAKKRIIGKLRVLNPDYRFYGVDSKALHDKFAEQENEFEMKRKEALISLKNSPGWQPRRKTVYVKPGGEVLYEYKRLGWYL